MSPAAGKWLYRSTLVVLLVCFALWAASYAGEYVRDDDEGMNLMKARMVREGYVPHRDIWSDQPPLLTLCLALWFDLFGESVPVARTMIVAFACLGLAGAARVARLLGGRAGSIGAVIFLIFSPWYLDLSRSVMIGLPAHVLAALAMACGLMGLRTDREGWLIAAGVAMSGSWLIKPEQPFLFVPLAIIVWFQGRRSKGTGWWQRWGRKLLLLTVAAIIPLLIALCVFEPSSLLRQVVGTYITHRESRSFRLSRVISGLVDYIQGGSLLDWTGFLLALYGFALTWRRRDARGLAVSIWLISSLLAVSSQTRFRSRYLPALSFPLAGLLSVGMWDLTSRAKRAWTRLRTSWPTLAVCAVTVISLILGFAGEIRSALADTCCENRPVEEEAIAVLRSSTTPRGYVISDDGMLTFRAGLLTPPELAVISYRRMSTGQLTAETLVAASQKYSPEAIIMWDRRFLDLPAYVDWVERHYCLARAWSGSQRIYTACDMLQYAEGSLMQLGDLFGIDGWSVGVEGPKDGIASPGDTVRVTVRWQALQPTDADYHIFLHLGEDSLVSQWDGMPRQGTYPTYRWLQEEDVMDSYALSVPPGTPEGYYPLWVGMYDWADKSRLPVRDTAGRNVGSAGLLTHVRIGVPGFEVPAIGVQQEATLGDQVRLLGYELTSERPGAGDVAHLALYWQCLRRMDTSYTVFVHILDAEGNMIGQWDSPPHNGQLPTSTWVPGEIIRDSYSVPVVQEVDLRSYSVGVGMYDANTGQRLAVTDANGNRLPDDRIPLGDSQETS